MSNQKTPPAEPRIADERFALLENNLLVATEIFRGGPEHQREGCILALNAVSAWLLATPGVDQSKIATAFLMLGVALHDLDDGTVPDLLKPRKGKGKGPQDRRTQVIRGSVAGALHLLIHELDRPAEEAAREITTFLNKRDMKIPQRPREREPRPEWKTVLSWMHDAAKSSRSDRFGSNFYRELVQTARRPQSVKDVLGSLGAVLDSLGA